MIATAPRTLSYQLYDVQDDFVADQSRYVAFVGGRNAGKTFCGSVKAMLHVLEPETLGVVAAPNFPMLEHGAKRQFLDRLEESGIPFITNNQKGNLVIPDLGSEVLFATLESESRVRGPNFHWGWGDELDYLYDAKVWRALKGAIRAGGNPQLFATSTPKGRRLIYQEWVRDATERHRLYRATTYDNPFIDAEDYVSGLGYEGRFAEQEINAEFVSFDGLVYDMFDRSRNVKHVDTTGWRTVLGVDVGARNPTVVLVIRIASDGRVHIEREYYQRGMGSTAILNMIEQAADDTSPEAIYIDPSAAAYIDDLVSDGYPAEKANNDVQTGIQRVTTAFADGLTVDPSCINTITEFESYQYSDKGKDTDKPLKQNDHCLVAGTMVTTISGDKAIESIQNGELVLTRDGYQEVISAGMTNPSAEVMTVYLSNGKSITGTGGHPVFANGQWVLLNELRYGDILMETKEMSSCELKPSSIAVSSSDDIQNQRTSVTGSTIGHTPGTSVAAFKRCIGKSGRITTGQYRTDTTSTTSTATPITTISRILCAFRQAITSAITAASRHLSVNWSTLNLSVTLPLNGMAPTPALSGIVSTASVHGQSDSRFVEPASNVASNMTTSLAGLNRGSALISAGQHTAAHPVSMMKTGHASTAVQLSESTSTAAHAHAPVRVLAVSKAEQRQAVYNLTVAGTPEYFANGVLVHNCMDAGRYGIMGGTAPVVNSWVW